MRPVAGTSPVSIAVGNSRVIHLNALVFDSLRYSFLIGLDFLMAACASISLGNGSTTITFRDDANPLSAAVARASFPATPAPPVKCGKAVLGPCTLCQGHHYDEACPERHARSSSAKHGKSAFRPCALCQGPHYDKECPERRVPQLLRKHQAVVPPGNAGNVHARCRPPTLPTGISDDRAEEMQDPWGELNSIVASAKSQVAKAQVSPKAFVVTAGKAATLPSAAKDDPSMSAQFWTPSARACHPSLMTNRMMIKESGLAG